MDKEIKTIPAKNIKKEYIARLPLWVQENLDSAILIGNSYRTIQLLDGRKYSLDNEINDLDGAEWTKNICSVINTHYSTKGEDSFAHDIRKVHPTPNWCALSFWRASSLQAFWYFWQDNPPIFTNRGTGLWNSHLQNRNI